MRPLNKRGFTLIELMISVVLMLILVGAVVMVFRDTSNVFTMAEAKMSVYQNARAALELMSRELTSADNTEITLWGIDTKLTINNPGVGASFPFVHLRFKTNTSWISGTTRQNGMAFVEYYSEAASGLVGSDLWNLKRRVRSWDTGTNALTQRSDDILAQYIAKDSDREGLRIDYFNYSGGTWTVGLPVSAFAFPYNSLPGAIRITMVVTDKEKRVQHTVSRTVWLPKSN